MLNNKQRKIVYPMAYFPISYKNEIEVNELKDLFRKYNFEIEESLLKKEYKDLSILAISMGKPMSDGTIKDVIFLHETKASYAALWGHGKYKAVNVKDLIKYFKEIFVDKDEKIFLRILPII